MLDGEIPGLHYSRFPELTPLQIPLLSPEQIATIPNDYEFGLWSQAQREALAEPQVQALQVSTVHLPLLASWQIGWLTEGQIQSLHFNDFKYLSAAEIPELTTVQIASVPNEGEFELWPESSRAAVTELQTQALQIAAIHLRLLSHQQRLWLTTAQIQTLMTEADLAALPPEKIPSLSDAQIREKVGVYLFGTLWTPAQRAALTESQIHALQVRTTRISYVPSPGAARVAALTPTQMSWLTDEQIHALLYDDFYYLLPTQVSVISPQQFSEMPNLAFINSLSDAARAALGQAQLMSLPFNLLSQYMTVEHAQYPPSAYHSPMNDPATGLVSGGSHSMLNAANLLAPSGQASHRATASGDWTDPDVWQNGQVPTAGATVLIDANATVRFNANMTFAVKTLRIDGALIFATDVDTTLRVDTIVVDTNGRLHIGTEMAPIADDVVAKVLIPDGGPIDTAWDPFTISRGLVSRGETRMFGRTVTPYVSLTTDPMAGATTLSLSEAPIGWRVGDELIIAGTQQHWATNNYGAENVRITAISGTTITLDRPLSYHHDAPDGQGFSVHVANLNRNIQFLAEDPSVIKERPHMVFFENPNVKVENILVNGFGRTDKTKAVTDPVVVNGVLQPGTGENPRARYAFHFHHTGVNPLTPPAVIRGNLVLGSPGWGYVNHQSNVVMENNVALGVVGAGFATEDGNEIGAMRRNLSMTSTGSGQFFLVRAPNHDFGHGGHGFWLQGPGVELVGNVVSGTRGGAYAYGTSSSKTMFDAVNLVDPSIAAGRPAVPVGAVPLRAFQGNAAYAVREGLEIWFHMTNLNHGETVIEGFTAWNVVDKGIQLPYSGLITIRNAKLFGSTAADAPYGILTNRRTQNIRFENISVEGFDKGLVVPVRRSTVIAGARLANVQNILILKGHDAIRTLDVTTPINFVPLTPTQLGSRQAYNVALLPTLAPPDNTDRQLNSVFSADDLQFMMNDGSTAQLYFAAQAANVVPFPSAPSPPISGFPSAYVGKTNLQLWQQYGVWVNGGDLPAGASTPAGFNGILAVIAVNAARDGDFNGDGAVDGADFLTWQRGAGTLPPHGTKSQGDADQDQDVDGVDLGIWKGSFGTRPAGNAVSSVTTPLASFVAADSEPIGAPRKLDRSLYAAAMAHDQAIDALEPRKLLRWRFSRPRAGSNA